MLTQLIKRLHEDPNPPQVYTWKQDKLRYKSHLLLIPNSTLKQRVLTTLQSLPLARHSGFQKTYACATCSFFWEGMKRDILTFVAKCDSCQWNKGEIVKIPQALQPLPIPPTLWTNISMDFIVGLSKASNKSFIMMVVHRLSKYAHFCALQHPFTSIAIAQIFVGPDF